MRKFVFPVLLTLVCLFITFATLPTPSDASSNSGRGAECTNNLAQTFPCSNVNLLSHLPLSEIGGATGVEGNDSWGWTDSRDGREYAIMGLSSGTAFVDITNPNAPVYLGHLPTQTVPSSWRDIKVHNDHAFIVSEATGHGMQIVDLTQLRDISSPPVQFQNTAHYNQFGNAHNIVINEESGFAYAVGASTGPEAGCAGGLHMVDISNPVEPQFSGCFSDDGYTHDAQCVIYNGPDTAHQGKEICLNSNEDTVTIVDVSDKNNPIELSRTPYAGAEYTHQGWLTEDHTYFISNDELDEQENGHNTHTYIWDVSDLDEPGPPIGVYVGAHANIDHNLYIKDGKIYQANYRGGLRILDSADVANGNLSEIGYFDIYPDNNNAEFNGAWNTYPYYDSGVVIISGIEQGLFTVRTTFDDGYAISADPSRVLMCGDETQSLSVSAEKIGAYADNVTLSVGSMPAELTLSSDVLTIAPGSSSDFVLESQGLALGTYSIAINGMSSGGAQATSLLVHQAQTPPAAQLITPADGSTDVARIPTLSWDTDDASSYTVQVATDEAFDTLVVNTTTADNTYTFFNPLSENTTYYWRIAASNGCGTSAFSTGSFTVEGPPTIDPADAKALFETGVENGLQGWQANSVWEIVSTDVYEGENAFAAVGGGQPATHELLAPSVTIPDGAALLSFWHKYELEQRDLGCMDAAYVEVSTDGGTTWESIDANLFGDLYKGKVANKFNNTVTDQDAWCGDSRGWRNVNVDMSDYAGSTVSIRFVLLTDLVISSPGWRVDNISLIGTRGDETRIFLPFITVASE